MAIVLLIICSDYNLSPSHVTRIQCEYQFVLQFFWCFSNSQILKSFEFFWIDIKITFEKKSYAWMCTSYNVTNCLRIHSDNITLLCKYMVFAFGVIHTYEFHTHELYCFLLEKKPHIKLKVRTTFCFHCWTSFALKNNDNGPTGNKHGKTKRSHAIVFSLLIEIRLYLCLHRLCDVTR